MIRPLTVALVAPLPVSYGLPPTWRAVWTLAVIATLLGLALLGRVSAPRGWRGWIAATYLAAISAVSASAASDDLAGHVKTAVLILSMWGLAPFVIAYLAQHSPRFLRSAAVTYVAAQTFSSLVALGQTATGGTVLGAATEFGRAPGLAGHTNILGLLGSIAVLLCATAYAKRDHRVLAILCGGINFAAVVASGSLSALFALLGAALFAAIAHRVRLRSIIALGVLLVVSFQAATVVSATLESFRSPFERILQTTGQTGEASTLQIREMTWQYAWQQIQLDPIFGAGLDDTSGATFDQITLTHNLPLRAWFQGGIALLVAVMVVYGLAARLIVRSIRLGHGAAEVGILAACVAFSLTSASMEQPYFWLPFLAAGASLVVRFPEAARQAAPVAPGHQPQVV